MNDKLVTRFSNREDLKDLELLHYKKNGLNRRMEVWEWEYFSENQSGSFLYVLSDNKRIIGTQGILPIKFNINGQIVIAGKSESTLIDKDTKIKDAFLRLYESTLQEASSRFGFVFGFTLIPALFKRLFGFKTFSLIKSLILPYNHRVFESFLESRISEKPQIIKEFIFLLSAIYCSSNKLRINILYRINKSLMKKCEIREVCREADYQSFFKEIHKKFPGTIHIHHDPVFINWRIKCNPVRAGYVYYSYSNNNLEGIMYMTCTNGKLFIEDFLFLNRRSAHRLAGCLIELCNQKKIGFVHYLGNSNNFLNKRIFRFLRHYGFISTGQSDPGFILKNLSDDKMNAIYDVDNWYITNLFMEGI